MSAGPVARALGLTLAFAACKGGPPSSPSAATSTSTPASTPTSIPTSIPTSSAPALASKGTACGPLDCLQFDRAEDAFLEAITGSPRIVAVGEAHAPKGATVPSSAKRFTETILPQLAGRASDLLVELMMPPSGCAAKAKEVKKKQEVVTSQQAASDQNEYVAMGERARALGIVPDLLRPTCGDLDAIRDAGGEAVTASLETIARLTTSKVKELVDRDARSSADADKMVLTYGGAIHNDLSPPKDREAWSFGPELDAYVGGHYVAIDLYVPEFIDHTDAWKGLPWYPYYDRAKLGAKVTRFRVGPKSYAVVFARSAP